MGALAKALGVSQNTIYWYFETKDVLLLAVAEAVCQRVLAEYLDLEPSDIATRLHWLHGRVRLNRGIVAAVHGRLTSSDEVRAWHGALHERLLAFFTAHLASVGMPETAARTIVQTGLLIFEGLAVLDVSDAQADEVFAFMAASMHAAAPDTAALRGQVNRASLVEAVAGSRAAAPASAPGVQAPAPAPVPSADST